MIPRETLDKIHSAAKIEEVVSDYVSLKRRGANLIGLCPFHEEKTGSFTVSPSKEIYKCFGCGKSGHVVQFVMDVEHCSYIEAMRILAKRYHIDFVERELSEEEQKAQDDRESMYVVNDFANEWFKNQLWETREGNAIGLSYFRERGLHDETMRQFQLGYAPEKSLLYSAAKQKGLDDRFLLNDSTTAPYVGTGLCLQSEDGRMYDRFRARVIFPFFSQSGKVVGFAGRIMKANDKAGKYVNSPTSVLFEKHNELYGLFQASQEISKKQCCYLVEGQMDVISMHQAGIKNVVASGGTSLTKPQIRKLHRFTNNITILYDGDKAGIKAALRGIDLVLEEGVKVKVVLLPDGEDPDSFARSHNASDLIDYIAQNEVDFIRFKTQLLSSTSTDDPIQRSEMIQSIVKSISVIPDGITRQVYCKDCAMLMGMEERVLSHEMAKLHNSQYLSQTSTTPAPKPKPSQPDQKQQSIFDKNMENLLYLLVRYGERALFQEEDRTISVGAYILQSLKDDDIKGRNPIHIRILEEYESHYPEVDFVPSVYFTHHPDIEVSDFAVRIITDDYPLSRIYSEQSISENVKQVVEVKTDADKLPELTTQLILELKFTIVNERMDSLQATLKQAEQSNNWELTQSVLQLQPQLLEVRSQLCRMLGNREIPK